MAAGRGMNIKGKFMPLNSGPADAQDPPGSPQDTNPFIKKQLAGGPPQKKKKKHHSQAQQNAISRRLAGGKGSGRN